MERAILMVRPDQEAKLNQLAKRAHVSTAEIDRRAIDAYDSDLSDDQEQVELLAEAIIQSSAIAIKALQEALKSVQQSPAYFSKKRDI